MQSSEFQWGCHRKRFRSDQLLICQSFLLLISCNIKDGKGYKYAQNEQLEEK